MSVLKVENIQKSFGDTKVLDGISFTMEKGEVLAMIGSSGSGKTTLLRCLNFLERPDGGRILMGDKVLFDAADPRTTRESEIRKKRLHFGLVFQNFNLFPQYTALQNVTLAKELLAKEQQDYKQNKQRIRAQIEEQGKALLEQMRSVYLWRRKNEALRRGTCRMGALNESVFCIVRETENAQAILFVNRSEHEQPALLTSGDLSEGPDAQGPLQLLGDYRASCGPDYRADGAFSVTLAPLSAILFEKIETR